MQLEGGTSVEGGWHASGREFDSPCLVFMPRDGF